MDEPLDNHITDAPVLCGATDHRGKQDVGPESAPSTTQPGTRPMNHQPIKMAVTDIPCRHCGVVKQMNVNVNGNLPKVACLPCAVKAIADHKANGATK